MLDNCGLELVADLFLVDALLEAGARVTLHAKAHPVFVSDVVPVDFEATLAWLAARPQGAEVASRLRNALSAGKLAIEAPEFYTTALAFWEMPEVRTLI